MSPALGRRLGLGDREQLLVRLGGSATLVRSAEQSITALGDSREVGVEVWDRLRRVEPSGAAVVRLGSRPANIGTLWSTASVTAERAGGYAHSTVERGVVRCVVPVSPIEEDNGRLRGMIDELQSAGSRIFERLPASLWPDVPSSVADALSSNTRRAFDPDRVLNRGILGDSA
jgi:hypothetical protein